MWNVEYITLMVPSTAYGRPKIKNVPTNRLESNPSVRLGRTGYSAGACLYVGGALARRRHMGSSARCTLRPQ